MRSCLRAFEGFPPNASCSRWPAASSDGRPSTAVRRWQLWGSAIDEFETKPLVGRGAGSFESWWLRHGSIPLFVKDAPKENLVIRGCVMKDGHGGVTIGSEASGGVRNVFAEDCRMDSPNLDRVLRLKTNSVRGGTIENIFMRNITAGQVSGAAVDIDLYYEEGPSGKFPPTVRNVAVQPATLSMPRAAWRASSAVAPCRE